MGSQKIVQRCDRTAPFDLARGLQPFGVLVEHRIDNVDERFVAVEEPMPAGEQVAFEPALTSMFAQDLHHPAIRAQMLVVVRKRRRIPGAAGRLEQVLQSVRRGLVRAEYSEIPRRRVPAHHFAQKRAHHFGRFTVNTARMDDRHREILESRQAQRPHQRAAIGMRIGAHPAVAHRRQRRDLGAQPAGFVEQFLRSIAPHPVVEKLEMLRLVHREWHLMGAPRTFCLETVDQLRASPALQAAQNDHRPNGPLR